ncbi:CheR family methyltransferase [Phenylobacterium montanum]|uniref:Chemotaxis protein methyltransferase n=1 Tax=Phenylobacterium montanum TaxID=2823693 RepID=A0A975G123_9CAUL|nr:protein-glutamate O-methyltransferase CheR [Caulobacter sp. S6]QUD88001.1 protein-glutamate O-methyltransferase CheR [Caulobacter sp. S6]
MSLAVRPTSAASRQESVVDGEYPFTADDFRRIAALLYDTAGITLSDSKTALVYSRLAKRLRLLGLSSFRDYCKLVEGPNGHEERQDMLRALTTNVTRFFREPHHFDHLLQNVIQPAIDGVRRGARLRIWSAGCSSGQEPYSMALTILSALPDAPNYDVKILATDIDTNVIAKGLAASYAEELVDAIPTSVRSKWMERDPDEPRNWRMGEAARALVAFKPLNLMGDWPMKGQFQAIFCRNVVIYFDEPTQERIFRRFHGLLTPGGRLYVGHSERVGVPGFETDGLTTYRHVRG